MSVLGDRVSALCPFGDTNLLIKRQKRASPIGDAVSLTWLEAGAPHPSAGTEGPLNGLPGLSANADRSCGAPRPRMAATAITREFHADFTEPSQTARMTFATFALTHLRARLRILVILIAGGALPSAGAPASITIGGAPVNTNGVYRDAFWAVNGHYNATYFCRHEHIVNVQRYPALGTSNQP